MEHSRHRGEEAEIASLEEAGFFDITGLRVFVRSRNTTHENRVRVSPHERHRHGHQRGIVVVKTAHRAFVCPGKGVHPERHHPELKRITRLYCPEGNGAKITEHEGEIFVRLADIIELMSELIKKRDQTLFDNPSEEAVV